MLQLETKSSSNGDNILMLLLIPLIIGVVVAVSLVSACKVTWNASNIYFISLFCCENNIINIAKILTIIILKIIKRLFLYKLILAIEWIIDHHISNRFVKIRKSRITFCIPVIILWNKTARTISTTQNPLPRSVTSKKSRPITALTKKPRPIRALTKKYRPIRALSTVSNLPCPSHYHTFQLIR